MARLNKLARDVETSGPWTKAERSFDMDTVQNPQSSRNNRFDRTLGSLIGIPGVLGTSAATVRAATPMTGEAQTFIIQTFRRREEGDGDSAVSQEFVFVEYVD